MKIISDSILATAILAAILTGLAGCGGSGTDRAPARAVEVSVVPGTPNPAPGRPLTVAWRFALGDGWHLYGPGRNDSGYPPVVALDLPAGWRADPLRWPVPERLVEPGGILDHVYHHELVLLQDLVPPAGAEPGRRVSIPARITWLACRQMCVPGDTTLTLELETAAAAAARPEPELIAAARSRLPVAAPEPGPRWRWDGATLRVAMPGARRLTFFPDRDCGALVDAIADADVRGDELALRFRPRAGVIGPVRGLLRRVDDAGGSAAFAVDWPGPESATETETEPETGQ